MKEQKAPAPLFRDPIYDCPTDPVVVWNSKEGLWHLLYTQRRATDPNIGSSHVHGTKIGVATSADGGKWLYRGTLEGLDIERGHNTFWAPEILFARGKYHMYVSYITGVPVDWDYPRKMLHYTSSDLWDWTFERALSLGSDRVIDACVFEIAPSVYKMWYKDEEHGSRTHAALSRDLLNWEPMGEEISDCAQEGPNVFEFQGIKWMVSDFWNGLAVYRSEDFAHWERCQNILDKPGTRNMDKGLGHHADIVVCGDRAYIFYFCTPFAEADGSHWLDRHKAAVQVAELKVAEGKLVCDRNEDVILRLTEPEHAGQE